MNPIIVGMSSALAASLWTYLYSRYGIDDYIGLAVFFGLLAIGMFSQED